MKRIPEPELMEAPAQVAAYAAADFSEPNEQFCALFTQYFPAFAGERIVDLGCGPADIPLRLARAYRAARMLGVDGSTTMLDWARRAAVTRGLDQRIEFVQWHIGSEPAPTVLSGVGDAVISNSLLHHLADPDAFWDAISACAVPGAAVLVMDLRRPASERAAQALLRQYAADQPPILQRDFSNSLMAAYREDEVRKQLATAGMTTLSVERVSDRHLAVFGKLF